MTILYGLPCCFTQGNTCRIFAWVSHVSADKFFIDEEEKPFPKYPYSKCAAFWKTLPLNWPAFKHWPPADLIYSTLACVSFYAIVSAVYWVVCLGLPSCECMSVYNYRCVCVSQCENVSLLSHMRWQSLNRAPFDIHRILGISQHTHSLFNLFSWSLSSSMALISNRITHNAFDTSINGDRCQSVLKPELG